MNELNAELREALKSRNQDKTRGKFKQQLAKLKLSKCIDITLHPLQVERQKEDGIRCTVNTFQATFKVKPDKMLEEGRLDGFWLLVTNHSEKKQNAFLVSVTDAIQPYRDKTVIEESFRDIKAFLEVAPVYVWTEKHVKAHYIVCILSHLFDRTISIRLHDNPGSLLSMGIVSHQALYRKLSHCQLTHLNVQNVGLSTYATTQLTAEQEELLKRTQMTYVLKFNLVEKANRTTNVQ